MIKRIIEISQQPTRLSVKLGQLIVRAGDEEPASIPCEDIGLLVVDQPATSYSHAVFTTLLEAGATVIFCGSNHHPQGVLMPVAANSIQTERTREQLSVKEPLRKQLWRQLVQAKIRHQAAIVGPDSDVYGVLRHQARQVRSGDPGNVEAQASRCYWPAYLNDLEFRRRREGHPPNNLLNYGYAILRAAVARAVVGAGLLPSVGLHHRNRYNAFCLADDLLEPFRGFVEGRVRDMWQEADEHDGYENLDQATKAQLLAVLYQEIRIADQTGPLLVGLHRTAASLVRCFAGESKALDLPQL